jgi:hypothetical protein
MFEKGMEHWGAKKPKKSQPNWLKRCDRPKKVTSMLCKVLYLWR